MTLADGRRSQADDHLLGRDPLALDVDRGLDGLQPRADDERRRGREVPAGRQDGRQEVLVDGAADLVVLQGAAEMNCERTPRRRIRTRSATVEVTVAEIAGLTKRSFFRR